MVHLYNDLHLQMDTSLQIDMHVLIAPYRYEYERIKAQSAGAHPGWSHPCAHCCALDSPAAWLRSSLRSTRGSARRRPAAPRRSCSCRRAQVTLHGTGCPHAHAQPPGVYAYAVCVCRADRRRATTQSCASGCRGRRAGFGGDGREWHSVLGLLGANGAEDSLAASQLGFATGDARRIILGCHLGVAYDAEHGQHPEDRSAAPAASKICVRTSDRKPIDLRRCSVNRRGRVESDGRMRCVRASRQRVEASVRYWMHGGIGRRGARGGRRNGGSPVSHQRK